MSPSVGLEVERVSKWLGGRQVLHEVSMVCAAGECVVLQGTNGSGKSTLLRSIAGVLAMDGGRVTLGGERLVGRVKRRVGYVPEQLDAVPQLSVGELWRLCAALRGCAPVSEALAARLELSELGERRLLSLSLGQKRRAFLAAALAGEPGLLLLDEPDNGLDVGGIAALVALVQAQTLRGAAAVVATHDETLAAALGGRRVRLAAGRVV